jgi:hypothetical protein
MIVFSIIQNDLNGHDEVVTELLEALMNSSIHVMYALVKLPK